MPAAGPRLLGAALGVAVLASAASATCPPPEVDGPEAVQCRLRQELARLEAVRLQVLARARRRGIRIQGVQAAPRRATRPRRLARRECASEFEVAGAKAQHPKAVGLYSGLRSGGQPFKGEGHGGRQVYNNSAGKYLYFLANGSRWHIGDSYDSVESDLASSADAECPSDAAQWLQHNGSKWEKVSLTVEVTAKEWVYADALWSKNDTVVENAKIQHIRAERLGQSYQRRSVLLDTYRGRTFETPVLKKRHSFWNRRRHTKAVSMLLAHMGGFAAIRAGNSLQQMDIFQGAKVMACIPIIINQGVIQFFFRCSKALRARARVAMEGMTRDDELAEDGLGHLCDMVEEESVEGENDISSLSMSFLIVNVARFIITGNLPNAEGEEPQQGWEPQVGQVVALYACALSAGLLVVPLVLVSKSKLLAGGDDHSDQLKRILETLLNTSGMTLAWCVLWATRWVFVESSLLEDVILGRVLLAFALTSLAGVAVFGMDKVDDFFRGQDNSASSQNVAGRASGDEKESEKENARSDDLSGEMIRILINALGILVGFSWEHCFNGAVLVVSGGADESPEHVAYSLFIGVSVCLLVLPAWRSYILQKVMLMEEMMSVKRGRGSLQPKPVLAPYSAPATGRDRPLCALACCRVKR